MHCVILITGIEYQPQSERIGERSALIKIQEYLKETVSNHRKMQILHCLFTNTS